MSILIQYRIIYLCRNDEATQGNEMTTPLTATETPILEQWMVQAKPTDLSQWAIWANAELQQLRLVNAQLHDELARMMTGGVQDSNARDSANADDAMADEVNAELWQAEYWFADADSRDAMIPELLASPLYGANVHE